MELIELAAQVAVDAAHRGGQKLMEHFERTQATKKSQSYNLVTEADIQSEKAIIDTILAAFPNHDILGEESSHLASPNNDVPNESEYLWVVDPLDGTSNFVHGIQHFAVSIAMFQNGKPAVGVVLNPATEEVFFAKAGEGATRNGQLISVNDESNLNETIVGVGFYYDRDTTMRATLDAITRFFEGDIHGIRRLGTASLDLCNVACGRFGAYFEYELAPWDFAAGWLVVTEAGGSVTDCKGLPLKLENSSVLATNNLLHETAAQITRQHYPTSHLKAD